jgi:molybdopterin synthase sulfur carrier subunit
MKPGKPFAFGVTTDAGVPIFGLAGNPVSTLVGFEAFVRPALRRLGGHRVLDRLTVAMVLDCPLPRERDGRLHLAHAVARVHGDGRCPRGRCRPTSLTPPARGREGQRPCLRARRRGRRHRRRRSRNGARRGPVERTTEVARLVLLGPARDAAGTRVDIVDGDSLGAVLDEAVRRYGPEFQAVLEVSRVWLNGEPADAGALVNHDDEIAVLPPVSGG